MEWLWTQLRPILRANWRLLPIVAVLIPIAYIGFGPVAASGLVLVLATLVLAWVTWGLARANQSSANHSKREEIRGALKAARLLLIIHRDEFGDVLRGDKRHGVLDTIEELASYANCFRDPAREQLQAFAAEIDALRIEEKIPDVSKLTSELVSLQKAVVVEMKFMRVDLTGNPW